MVAYVFLWFASAAAHACSCAGPAPTATRLLHSDEVFHGRAVAIHRPWFSWGSVVTEFQVIDAWKGVTTDRVRISTGIGRCCDCSLGDVFEPGQEALIFSHERTVSRCNFPILDPHAIRRARHVLGPPETVALTSAQVAPIHLQAGVAGLLIAVGLVALWPSRDRCG